MMAITPELNQRIALRVRGLRADGRLSLEALAAASGVSKSMISLIERGECSPTAVVLEKLASALGVTLASLFDADPSTVEGAASPVARRSDQPEWKDPGSGYVRRNVSPGGSRQLVQIVEVSFPAGARVAFETGGRDVRLHQQVWILDGVMEIATGADRHLLHRGDCLAMRGGAPTMFHNPGQKPARYAVITATEPPGGR